jgi:hypothetical protein
MPNLAPQHEPEDPHTEHRCRARSNFPPDTSRMPDLAEIPSYPTVTVHKVIAFVQKYISDRQICRIK